MLIKAGMPGLFAHTETRRCRVTLLYAQLKDFLCGFQRKEEGELPSFWYNNSDEVGQAWVYLPKSSARHLDTIDFAVLSLAGSVDNIWNA